MPSSKRKKKPERRFHIKKLYVSRLIQPASPFSGYWTTVTKGNNRTYGQGQYIQADIDSFIYIDTSDSCRVIIRTFAGTNLQPRIPTVLDVKPSRYNEYHQISPTTLVGKYNMLGQSGKDFEQFPSSFALSLQSDGSIIATTYSNPLACIQVNATKLIKVPEPVFRPYSEADVNISGDINDPVFLLKYIFDQLLHMSNPQGTDFRRAYAILDQLLTQEFIFTTPIKSILKSHNSPTTTIYTESFSYVTPGSTVVLSGFTGPDEILNGEYINGVSYLQYAAVPFPSASHVHKSTFPFSFLLRKDTSAMDITSLGTVTVRHKVRSNTEYPAFVAAVHAMFYLIWEVAMHNGYTVYYPPGSYFLYDTWEALQTDRGKDIASATTSLTRLSTCRPSGFYNLPAFSDQVEWAGNYLINDPFGINPLDDKYFYDIDLFNYLQLDTVRNLYWKMSGEPSGPWREVQANVQKNFHYKSNGRTFTGITAAFFPMSTLNADPSIYTLFGGSLNYPSPHDIVRDKNRLYFGRIASGIGYIRLRDFPAADPFNLVTSGFFCPFEDSPKPCREALSRVLSAMMYYLVTELSSRTIIIDIRGNGGGSPDLAVAISEFFGDTRPGVTSHAALKDDGTAPYEKLQEGYITFNDTFAFTQKQYATLYAGYNQVRYPGSVFTNGTVIILDDFMSVSSGEIFPNLFLGKDLNKQLGSDTIVKFAGDIDGRIKGFAAWSNPMPVSQKSSYIKDASGQPVSPIEVGYDAGWGFFPWSMGDYYLNDQREYTAIDIGPLVNTWDATVWRDLGYIGAGGQNPDDQLTWTDTWLQIVLDYCNASRDGRDSDRIYEEYTELLRLRHLPARRDFMMRLHNPNNNLRGLPDSFSIIHERNLELLRQGEIV